MPCFGKGGDFVFEPQMSRLIPRITRTQEKVKNPTLTSNCTTLGWGTLGDFYRDEGFRSPGAFGWATRRESQQPRGGTERIELKRIHKVADILIAHRRK